MKRRGFLALVCGLTASPFLTTKERRVWKLAGDCWETIRWKDIQAGDVLLIEDLSTGKRELYSAKAYTSPDFSEPGWPVQTSILDRVG